jgi:hypothetical protein
MVINGRKKGCKLYRSAYDDFISADYDVLSQIVAIYKAFRSFDWLTTIWYRIFINL